MNKKLLGYRKMLGLTQKQMADLSDMCLTTYNFKEQGKADFTQTEMEKITEIIKEKFPDVTMDEIFFRTKVIKMKTQQTTA